MQRARWRARRLRACSSHSARAVHTRGAAGEHAWAPSTVHARLGVAPPAPTWHPAVGRARRRHAVPGLVRRKLLIGGVDHLAPKSHRARLPRRECLGQRTTLVGACCGDGGVPARRPACCSRSHRCSLLACPRSGRAPQPLHHAPRGARCWRRGGQLAARLAALSGPPRRRVLPAAARAGLLVCAAADWSGVEAAALRPRLRAPHAEPRGSCGQRSSAGVGSSAPHASARRCRRRVLRAAPTARTQIRVWYRVAPQFHRLLALHQHGRVARLRKPRCSCACGAPPERVAHPVIACSRA